MEAARTILTQSGFEEPLVEQMMQLGRLKKAKVGEAIISPGEKGGEIPFVIKGLLKVMRQDENGHEVFLYFLEGGETCAMSITCCLDGSQGAFHVVAEEDVELWMVPVVEMDSWVVKYKEFRRFVFRSYQLRFDELLATIDSVVFLNLEERLFKYLLDLKQASGSYIISKTHEQIAKELSTSRVVISRLLKKLEKEEKIEQSRNRIEVL